MRTEANIIPCPGVNTEMRHKCLNSFPRKYILHGDKTEPMRPITCQTDSLPIKKFFLLCSPIQRHFIINCSKS